MTIYSIQSLKWTAKKLKPILSGSGRLIFELDFPFGDSDLCSKYEVNVNEFDGLGDAGQTRGKHKVLPSEDFTKKGESHILESKPYYFCYN